MTRILVHEFVSASALPADDALMAAGRAMRDALVDDLSALPGLLLSVVVGPAAPLQRSDVTPVWATPGEDPLALLAREALRHDRVWVVAPETGGLLARCQALVGSPRWVGCDAASLRVASSKRATLAALQRQAIATPRDGEWAVCARRWVVKPDDGAGATATRCHDLAAGASAEATRREGLGEVVTLEPWVDGEALSLSLLCQCGQAELLSVNRQQVRINADGVVHFDGVCALGVDAASPATPVLRDLSTRVARALPGLCGFVGVDLVWHAQRGPVVIEVNPRLTCAYVGLSRRLGRNLAGEILSGQPAPLAMCTEGFHATP